MELLMKFRVEAAKLEDEEIEPLVQSFVELCNKDDIISCIFNYFRIEYLSKKSISKLQNITDTISHIIENRKEIEPSEENDDIDIDENDDEQPQILSINSLPKDLINECTSYLQYDECKQFEQCNRSIFIAVRCPLKIYHLDLTKLIKINKRNKNIKNIKLVASMSNNPHQYLANPWIQSLNIDFETFIKFVIINPNGNQYKYNNLRHLDLAAMIKSMQIKGFNLSNIQKLTFAHRFGVKVEPFCDFLQLFPNLQCLSLRYLELDHEFDMNKMQNLINFLPHLTMISCRANSNFGQKMIAMLVNQLVSLTYDMRIEYRIDEGLDVNLSKLTKLQELHIKNANLKILSKCISKLPVLQRLLIEQLDDRQIDNNDIQTMAIGITKCKSLQYIGFYDDVIKLIKFVKYLKIAFVEMKGIKRERLKINLKVLSPTQSSAYRSINFDYNKFVYGVKDFVAELEIFSVNWRDFMIRIDGYKQIKRSFQKVAMKMINEYETKYDIFQGDFFFVISNKHCKINGFAERWLKKSTSCDE